jgi:hypothetical protein
MKKKRAVTGPFHIILSKKIIRYKIRKNLDCLKNMK